MKPSNTVEYVRWALTEMGISVPDGALGTCVRHLQWVLRTNESLNLTAIVDPSDAVRLHVVDSLAALPYIVTAEPGLIVDIGTGGGFPGLPLAVASDREALLVDSVVKKVAAIDSFLTEQRLSGIRTFHGRSEELAVERGQIAAVVVARAVAPLPVLVELAAPLLYEGGNLIALKGRPEREELDRSTAAASKVGLSTPDVYEYSLPGGGEQRTVVVYRRIDDPEIELPRRAGMAKKRPLA